ncbi:MAG TPA: ATPase, T2SS/T4P/T4SS family [Tepidisphaeraceae bacterium]|jgi:type II secretory ATPase GspE/PulE/Tfp pilus assembly ATPase PilB-like protein
MVSSEFMLAVAAGPYISWWKALLLVLVVLAWGRMLTWIDKDAQSVLLPRVPINLGMMLGGVLGIFLFFMLPGFPVAFLVLIGIIIAELGVYLSIRAQKAGLKDIGDQFSDWIGNFGRGEKKVKAVAGEVMFLTKQGGLMPSPDAEAPERPAYEASQVLLTEPLRRGAEQIDLVPADGQAVVKYNVDGVSYTGSPLEKGRAAAAVTYLKEIAGLDLNEKRKPQKGNMRVQIDGKKHELQMTTAGSTAGEQLRAQVDVKKRHEHRLETLGLPEDQVELITEMIRENTGVVLLSAPKGHGLTSLEYSILRAHDAFLSHIQTIEQEPAQDLEGITQNKVAKQTGEPQKTAEWITSQEPDVVLIDRLEDPKTAALLNKYSGNTEKRVYVGLRANSTFDALALWRQLIGDDSAAVRNLRMVINSRVMRKLCPSCKAGYTPDPATLKKLNLDPDKISKLYQARTQPLRDPKGNPISCEFCKELLFKGRMGVYEIFKIDDDVRAVVEAGGSSNQLKSVFRKQRGLYLQEMALLQVAGGDTSIQEVLRVMRTEESSGGGSSGGGGVPRSKPKPSGQPSSRPRA